MDTSSSLAGYKCYFESCEGDPYMICKCQQQMFCNAHYLDHVESFYGDQHIPLPINIKLNQENLTSLNKIITKADISLKEMIDEIRNKENKLIDLIKNRINREIQNAIDNNQEFKEGIRKIVNVGKLNSLSQDPIVKAIRDNLDNLKTLCDKQPNVLIEIDNDKILQSIDQSIKCTSFSADLFSNSSQNSLRSSLVHNNAINRSTTQIEASLITQNTNESDSSYSDEVLIGGDEDLIF